MGRSLKKAPFVADHLLKKIDSNNIVFSVNHAPEGWAECIRNVFVKIKSQEHLYG